MIIYDNNDFNNHYLCVLIAPALKGSPLKLKKFSNFKDLSYEFGQDSNDYPLVSMAKVLFFNNVTNIYCLPPAINSKPSKQNYIDAFKILEDIQGAHFNIVCDSSHQDIINELTKSIDKSAVNNTYRFGFVGLSSDFKQAIDIAHNVAHPKLILTFSKTLLTSNPHISSNILTATALAAITSSISNPIINLSTIPIMGLTLSEQPLNINSLNILTNAGISSLKYKKDRLEIYKIFPSKLMSTDITPNINNALIVDYVKISIINLVNNIKNSPLFKFLSCQSLKSQIILFLYDIKDHGLISNFKAPIINITSSINISISVKPESLFNNNYITININI